MFTKKEIYNAEFIPSRDGKYLSQFRPADRRLVPDYTWAISNHYEEFIPAPMSEIEKNVRLMKTREQIEEILKEKNRGGYTPWEIGQLWKRCSSGPVIITTQIYKGASLTSQCVLSLKSREETILSNTRTIVRAGLTALLDRLLEAQKKEAKKLHNIVKYEKMSAGGYFYMHYDEFVQLSPYPEEVENGFVKITPLIVFNILTNATIISPTTCDKMLAIMPEDASVAIRALKLIKANVSPPIVRGGMVPWVKKQQNNSYASVPLKITKESLIRYSSAIYPGDEITFPPEWVSTQKINVKCPKHGNFSVIPRQYVNGTRGVKCKKSACI